MVTESRGVEAQVKYIVPRNFYWFRGIIYKFLPARLTISVYYLCPQEMKKFRCVLLSEFWLVLYQKQPTGLVAK